MRIKYKKKVTDGKNPNALVLGEGTHKGEGSQGKEKWVGRAAHTCPVFSFVRTRERMKLLHMVPKSKDRKNTV